MEHSGKLYTLITGASVGIGRALAIECAKRNMNLMLLDLPDSGLDSTIHYLKKNYPVEVESFALDLTTPNAPWEIYNHCRNRNITVNMLINNAGLGHQGSFCDYDYRFYENVIRLNIESVILLTRLFLPEMRKLEYAYILNLGSLAAFYPIPFKTVYAGSKNFVYSFSRALKTELKDTPVKVSVLCPGPIMTNQEVLQRIRRGGFWAKMSTMRANKMAEIAISRLLKGKTVIIPGLVNVLLSKLNAIIPGSLKQHLLYKKFNVRDKI
ncbi:MAG: SDR family NAD(P)-dependent oxidoreductase [Bacteroidales bacterium]|nr:SDR family NAD(P)-dependent oxidoreductase [Bacteroidales bacterium]